MQKPGGQESTTSNVRRLRDLPDGTRVTAIVTDRDGTCIDSKDIPVENGRVKIARRSVRRGEMWYGR